MNDRIDPQSARDVCWREASRAKARLPHGSRRMQSLNSVGPLRLFVCPACNTTEYSVHTKGPFCTGGYGTDY